ncbi:hypothetical protein A5N15_11790 [Rothia kristinae]|uniref:Uncharacterized protein n=1 Tax=Rothia kristinae TaxID=37923 RepID=A0A657IV95_9MICC|nr:hypothetical protein A5N15_11790 [Rothia kristinae]
MATASVVSGATGADSVAAVVGASAGVALADAAAGLADILGEALADAELLVSVASSPPPQALSARGSRASAANPRVRVVMGASLLSGG